jgi:hypothetical protein
LRVDDDGLSKARANHRNEGDMQSTGILNKLRSPGFLSPTLWLIGTSCMALLLGLGGDSATAQNSNELRPPSEFSNIQDPQMRSRALFSEAAKVIMNPRCMNCHPKTDSPLQGNDQHAHMPPVSRGDSGVGVAGAPCSTCHSERNFTLSEKASYRSIPGHPRWGLAPIEMAWEGKSVGEICVQLKDPARNGGRDLALLQEHFAKDDLVAWGWIASAARRAGQGVDRYRGAVPVRRPVG